VIDTGEFIDGWPSPPALIAAYVRRRCRFRDRHGRYRAHPRAGHSRRPEPLSILRGRCRRLRGSDLRLRRGLQQ
jgi:hypothetical protein